jgi:selT/selW/selH-like putative selenoprotein
MPQAASLQSAIKEKFGIVPTLVEGHGGAFEVTVDGKRIFSKLKTFRFPEDDEILGKIEQLQQSA